MYLNIALVFYALNALFSDTGFTKFTNANLYV